MNVNNKRKKKRKSVLPASEKQKQDIEKFSEALFWYSDGEIDLEYARYVAKKRIEYSHRIRSDANREMCEKGVYKAVLKAAQHTPLPRLIKSRTHFDNIMEAHYRHTTTKYDDYLEEARELVANDELEKCEVRKYARTLCKNETYTSKKGKEYGVKKEEVVVNQPKKKKKRLYGNYEEHRLDNLFSVSTNQKETLLKGETNGNN
jgi:hypothetical protein